MKQEGKSVTKGVGKIIKQRKNKQKEQLKELGLENNDNKIKKSKKTQKRYIETKSYFNVNQFKKNVSKEKKQEEQSSSSSGATQTSSKSGTLHDVFEAKLKESKFRLLNEKLYSITGDEAKKMFAKDKSLFGIYHEGYRSAIKKWTIDPIEQIVKRLKEFAKNKVVADFGCGEARIATLAEQTIIHSFDLVAVNDKVTVCNMAHTPLKDGDVDVAIFCLSLMGTNFYDYIKEANRVLKTGGHLIIAEAESRLESKLTLFKALQQMGFELLKENRYDNFFRIFEFTKKNTEAITTIPKIEVSQIFKPWHYKKREK